METNLRTTPIVAAALLLASCSVQRTAQQSDDVYYVPSDVPMATTTEPAESVAPVAAATDDYYDTNASQQNSDPGGYYNMAYNDPYYYNYGRFGFGGGLASQNGWMMNGWGQPVQWGYGTGVYSGWYGGGGWTLGLGWGWGNSGWGGWNHSWGGYSPWGWNDPWYNGWGYGGYGYGGNGYGYGNYYGPYGGCSCCYTPIIVGGSSNVVVAHRPSFGNNASGVGGNYQRRMSFNDPIGLTPTERTVNGRTNGQNPVRTTARSGISVPSTTGARGERPILQRPTERQPNQRPNTDRTRNTERQVPAHRGGGSDRGGGSASPSRSGGDSGGGSRSPGTGRHR